jgi:hypothetical protein
MATTVQSAAPAPTVQCRDTPFRPQSPAISQYAANKHSKTHGRQHFRRNENLMSHRDIKPSEMPESWRIGSVLAPGQAPLIAHAGHRLLSRTLAAM